MIRVYTDSLIKKEAQNAHQVAIVYMLIAYFFHAVQITFFKLGQFKIVPQFLFLSSTLSVMSLFTGMKDYEYFPKNKLNHIIKSQICIGIGSLFYFYGVLFIPLSEAIILFSTNSIWTQFMVSYMDQEKITKSRLCNSTSCIIGVIFIANPQYQTDNSFMHLIGCLSVLFCSIIQSYAFIIMKKIGTDVPSSIVVFYFHIIMIILSSIQQLFIVNFEYFENYLIFLLGFTLFTLFAQLIKFRAQTMVTYDKICNYSYSQMIYILVIDYFVFSSVLSFHACIGSIFIIFGVFRQLSQDKK